MINLKNQARIKVCGVNIDKIYKLVIKNNIKISNIYRVDYKTILFNVDSKDKDKIFAILNNPCYTVSVDRLFGFSYILNLLKTKIMVVFASIIFLTSIAINNCFVSNIIIEGNCNVDEKVIQTVLNKNNIKKGALISSVNEKNCEDLLLSNFNQIGLVSVAIVGNCVIVNVKEKTIIDNEQGVNSENFVANYSGTIISMEVFEGTPLVKQGDSFSKGDILVAGFVTDENGNKIQCKANAKIFAKIWFSYSEEFENVTTMQQRTGKKISTSEYLVFEKIIASTNKKNTFENYEIENSTINVFENNFLPLKKHTITYYETKLIKIENNFEENKQKLIDMCYNKARQEIQNNFMPTKSFDTINKTEKGYVVSAYYEVETYM